VMVVAVGSTTGLVLGLDVALVFTIAARDPEIVCVAFKLDRYVLGKDCKAFDPGSLEVPHRGALVIVNNEGIPIRSTADMEPKQAVQYAALLTQLATKASRVLRVLKINGTLV